MKDETLVEVAERLRRGGLLGRANLAGHLPAPEEVVGDDDAPRAQQRQRGFEVLVILLFDGVEVDEVEVAPEAGQDFERVAALNRHAPAQARPRQVALGQTYHLVARLDGDDFTVFGKGARKVQRPVADGEADLQHAPRAD